MKLFQWILYFASLTAFLWFVFSRPRQIDPTVNTSQLENLESDTTYYSTDLDTSSDFTNLNQDEMTEVELSQNDSQIEEENFIKNQEYLIVLGSFSDEENAKYYVKKMSDLGLISEIVYQNSFYRVIAESHENKDMAQNVVKDIQKKYGLKAFVLKNER